jgi:hypothetical protein
VTNRLGLNIRISAVNDKGALYRYLQATRPATVVVEVISTNDMGAVQEVRAQLPQSSTVIVRVKDTDDGAQWQPGGITPEDYIRRYGAFGRGGLVLQVLNEPDPGGDSERRKQLSAWLRAVIDVANASGVTLCVFNPGTGNPSVNSQLSWEGYDELLQALATRKHLLGVHIYHIKGLDIGWMDSIEAVINRCLSRNLTPPRIAVTEYGCDIGGGENDGYAGAWGLSAQQYIALMQSTFADRWRKYVQFGSLEGLCIFAATDNGWHGFNVMPILRELQAAIAAGAFSADPVAPPVVEPPKPVEPPPFQERIVRLVIPGGNSLNFRAAPISGAVLTTLKTGDEVRLIGSQFVNEIVWYRAQAGNVTGWFAGKINAGDIGLLEPLPPKPPEPEIGTYEIVYTVRGVTPDFAQALVDTFGKGATVRKVA